MWLTAMPLFQGFQRSHGCYFTMKKIDLVIQPIMAITLIWCARPFKVAIGDNYRVVYELLKAEDFFLHILKPSNFLPSWNSSFFSTLEGNLIVEKRFLLPEMWLKLSKSKIHDQIDKRLCQISKWTLDLVANNEMTTILIFGTKNSPHNQLRSKSEFEAQFFASSRGRIPSSLVWAMLAVWEGWLIWRGGFTMKWPTCIFGVSPFVTVDTVLWTFSLSLFVPVLIMRMRLPL